MKNDVRLLPLQPEELTPYTSGSGVRIFYDEWFLGLVKETIIKEGALYLRVDPYIRYHHHDRVNPEHLAAGAIIPVGNFQPDGLNTDLQPFRFNVSQLQKLQSTEEIADVLILKFNGRGTLVLTRREWDILAIREFISKNSCR